jgi:EamA domain-containing membrane protein RarD
MIMSLLNITITFILYKKHRKQHKTLKYTRFFIDLNFYINLLGAVFYLWLFADKTLFGDRSAYYSDV